MKKGIKKSFVTVVLVLSMVFGMSIVSNAQTNVTTETISTSVYSTTTVNLITVKKSGSTEVLGKMKVEVLTASGSDTYGNGASTTFTALTPCSKVTSYASVTGKSNSYNTNVAYNLSKNSSCIANKSGACTRAYGFCAVAYDLN